MDWNIVVGVVGLLLSFAGVFYTRKAYMNTNSIKDSIDKALQKDRQLTEYDVLNDKLDECLSFINPKDHTLGPPLLSTQETNTYERIIQSNVMYVCERLLDIYKNDFDKVSTIQEINKVMSELQSSSISSNVKLTNYGIRINQLAALLKSL